MVDDALTETAPEGSGGLDGAALDQLFRKARTHNGWRDGSMTEDTLQAMWDLTKMGPTSANCSPARIVFVISPEAKAKLEPCLKSTNVKKTMAAPATAIIGYDMEFYERLPHLYPQTDARSWFVVDEALIRDTAFRNGSLQGGYFILAARALGLDCGPMSGFDNAMVDDAFFAGTSIRSNFLCNIGHGDASKVHPRNPRLAFEDACRVM